ncbi:MAG: aspartate carbamoyltransferase catalytic subunit [Thermovirgaceae bacterium]|jgi:aspartate carbamoyltransferase catalytic subunit|nr:aspartate carbamoyltransferase catalytic subunit [Synergistales bacterium]MDI9392090.1 aspartate carbamoyltransferase catalytic subunit [Synergistota bacterium]MDY0179317.1 aspartate carbamoyltransferase catalytic subunit [Synergistaceae bacterium]HRW87514.1 aspartate carbamoyltransferase catalytic subunit [Thermovirgaceae bacterium]MDD3134632.1 aspartate carbamoyltransferase catalytic subunit [Synergistales bacterium]
MEWRHRHVLDLDSWDRSELQHILEQTRSMDELLDRPIKKVPALRGKLVVNLFFEPSTRTRVSFELAEKFLSADVVNWTASGSSTGKGETLRDTAWTLEAMGADAVVVRHGAVGAADYLARKMRKSVVFNGGDGAHAHPTQALLDLYTAWKRLGDLNGRKLAMIGDVLHSRVARSDIIAFSRMGVKVELSGPPTLMPRAPEAMGAIFRKDPHDAVRDADIIYLLRIQRERQEEGMFPSLDEYHQFFGADSRLMESASPDALVMHPGPINRRVEISSEVADGPQSMILGQVRSGVALRMALLFVCLGGVRQ